jgi:WD40 repeat protein
VYGTQNGKHTKTFKGSHSDEGSLIKLTLDISGIYIATSCTDKTLSVYDYYSNECMARMYGHSELVTGLKFTNDCKHLISASGDGCVFVWQVPHDMVVTMQARLSQKALRSGHQPQTVPRPLSSAFAEAILDHQQVNNNYDQFGTSPNNFFIDDVPGVTSGYKFSDVGQLPTWAKRKPNEEQPSSPVLGTSPSQSQGFSNVNKPRGKWGQKSQFDEALDLRNIVDNPTFNQSSQIHHQGSHNNNNTPTSGYNSSGSKDVYSNAYLSEDSSIDSGRENRRELAFLNRKVGPCLKY